MARRKLESNIEQGHVTIANAVELTGVSRKVVQRWIDGNLVKWMQIPECNEVRINPASLVAMCRKNGMRVDPRLQVAADNYTKFYTGEFEARPDIGAVVRDFPVESRSQSDNIIPIPCSQSDDKNKQLAIADLITIRDAANTVLGVIQ